MDLHYCTSRFEATIRMDILTLMSCLISSNKPSQLKTKPTHLSMFNGSSLLTNAAHQKQLNEWYGNDKQQWKLLYKGSKDGFGGKDFHAKCDGQSPTLTIAQSENGYLFGGFNPNAWKSSAQGEYENSFASWIFSLTNPKNKPFKARSQASQYAIYHHNNHLPTFGTTTHDICIYANCNTNPKNGACLGKSFKLPSFISPGNEANTFLTGKDWFKISEVEIFTLQ